VALTEAALTLTVALVSDQAAEPSRQRIEERARTARGNRPAKSKRWFALASLVIECIVFLSGMVDSERPDASDLSIQDNKHPCPARATLAQDQA
jgi:hypothetical protein